MPSIYDLMIDTMMGQAASGWQDSPLGADANMTAEEPSPTVTDDLEVIKKNPVWSWQHTADSPSTFKSVKSKVRGMGMNYAMSMPVADTISLDEVSIKWGGYDAQLLPLDQSFVFRKYQLNSGSIAAGQSSLFPLQAEIDQSAMVLYGYNFLGTFTPKPLTDDDVKGLGSDLMPAPGGTVPMVHVDGVDGQVPMDVNPLRVIVMWCLTTCKERPDFTPGPPILGMNRIYPHVIIYASQPLDRVSAVVSVIRPSQAGHAGKLDGNPDTGEQDAMLADIRPVLFSDTNKNLAPAPFSLLPLWSHIFDYYSVDPAADGIQSVTMVDPSRTTTRTGSGAIQKFLPTSYVDATVTKVPGQGEFDNLHLAPRMSAPDRISGMPGWFLDSIAMAPFCFHDCLHTHTRWGLEFTDRQAWGFDANGNACAAAGAPLVPLDQTVRISLLPPAGFSYEAIVNPQVGTIPSGTREIFFHHGLGYANEVWDRSLFNKAMAGVEVFSLGEKNFSPTTAANSIALFYWRLRFGGNAADSAPSERIKFVAADSLTKLRNF